MKQPRIFSTDLLPTLNNREEYFERITQEDRAPRIVLGQYLSLVMFTFFYGAVMGSYHSWQQALSSGIKVSVLFTLALLICFPAFFIIQYILGSRLRLVPMIAIILTGFVLMAAVMVAFAPIIVIFLLTGSNYYFLQLLHIAVFILAGFFGMQTVAAALKFACEKRNVYPQTGVVVFRFWVVILAFVGIQLAWNFRPFLGDRGEPFQLFRHYEGNFYTALIYSAKQLFSEEPDGEAVSDDTLTYEAIQGETPPDSAALRRLLDGEG